MKNTKMRAGLAGVTALAILTLAGCGQATSSPAPAKTPAATTPATAPTTTSTSPPSTATSTGSDSSTGFDKTASDFATTVMSSAQDLQTSLSNTDKVTQDYINGNSTYNEFKSAYDNDMQKARADIQTIADAKAPSDKLQFQEQYVALMNKGLDTLQLREDAFTPDGGVDQTKLQDFMTQYKEFMNQFQSLSQSLGQ